MANPADEAAIEAAKANEQAALTYASGITKTAQESYTQFRQSAEQALAERYVIYAKSGNTGPAVGELPPSGVSPGTQDSEEYLKKKSDLEKQIDSLNSDIADRQSRLDKMPEFAKQGKPYDSFLEGMEAKKAELADAQKGLEGIGPGNAALGTLQSNPMTGHLSGSDLLTEVTFRDMAQRHGSALLRTAQNQAAAAVTQGENFNKQREYLEEAATYNQWNSILGAGLTVAGLAISLAGLPGIGLPMAGAGVATATGQ